VLANILLRNALLDAPTTLSVREQNFRTTLISSYDCDCGNEMIRCMLLDTGLPKSIVIASHLFQRSNEYFAKELMNIDNIDDEKNGLMLFKPIESAFDNFNLSFIYDNSQDTFITKLFNPEYKNKLLIDNMEQNLFAKLVKDMILPDNWRNITTPIYAPDTIFNLLTTFGDLDGQPLVFKSIKRPFKRCLNLQARLARNEAITKKWLIKEEYDFDDFWSYPV
jgi:hypothetical protein